MAHEPEVLGTPAISGTGRALLDASQPLGFVQYPYYTVREVALVLGISDDFVRVLFRGGRQGCALEIVNPRPGKRVYRTLLIPYQTLVSFINRHTMSDEPEHPLSERQRGPRRSIR